MPMTRFAYCLKTESKPSPLTLSLKNAPISKFRNIQGEGEKRLF